MIETSQNAAPDVEKMILGNKCDREEKRQVSKEKGQAVGFYFSSSSSSPLPHQINYIQLQRGVLMSYSNFVSSCSKHRSTNCNLCHHSFIFYCLKMPDMCPNMFYIRAACVNSALCSTSLMYPVAVS